MPAKGRRDLIRRLKVKQAFTNQVLNKARAVKQILVPNYSTDQIKGEKR